MSAATAYYNLGNTADLSAQANAVAASYGFVNGVDGATVTVNRPPRSGSHMATPGAVEVVVQKMQGRLFSAVWNSAPLAITGRAVSVADGGLGCVLSLDLYARGGTTIQGTAAVNLTECSLFDNSNDTSALTAGGSAQLSARSVGVVGGIAGGATITATDGVFTGQFPVSDPYAEASYPAYFGCDQHNYTAKANATVGPGVYCGGITVNSGAVLTLNAGIYYLDQGSLTLNGGATLNGSNVTLVFTSSNGRNYADASVNGGATVNLTAPTAGQTKGIVVFGDRSMPTGTVFKFNGGATQTFGGALYLPKAAVNFAGGAGTGAGCTQLVGNTITFVGNSGFAINCTGMGTKPLGSAMARPVE